MLEITPIALLRDNYAYLLIDSNTGTVGVIDPSEAGPVYDYLQIHDLKLDFILNTHHHWDHTGGNLELKEKTSCQIVGFAGDAERIPGIDIEIQDNGTFALGESVATILFIPGHTLGHIAYYFADNKALFCGDTLFSIGCGRMFEGDPPQMYASLQRLASLPSDTLVYPGHEYTVDNAHFAQTIERENPELKARLEEAQNLRNDGLPTIPSTMETELKTNPFLRADVASVQEALEMTGSDPVSVFAEIRKRKDHY